MSGGVVGVEARLFLFCFLSSTESEKFWGGRTNSPEKIR